MILTDTDHLLETALATARRFAESLRDDPREESAWKVTFELKRLRRPEVVAELDRQKSQRVCHAELAPKYSASRAA